MTQWTCPNRGCGSTRAVHLCPVGSTSPPPNRKPVPPEVYFGRPDWDAEVSPARRAAAAASPGAAKAPAAVPTTPRTQAGEDAGKGQERPGAPGVKNDPVRGRRAS